MLSPKFLRPSVSRAALLILAIAAALPAQTKLLRFPDVHGDKVAFSYAGNLWTAPLTGGTATRLTAHPGLEFFAKFSPDGKWIAFTGQYDGDEQVYVMPAAGGVPKQLTFYPARGPLPVRWGYDNQVYGWTPDGTGIVFRSFRDGWAMHDCRLYVVPMTGGLPVALEMPVSGAGDLSPDGSKVIYSPLFRDFRSWKRYEGGWAQDLYTFDRKAKTVEPVAHSPRTERDPMWIGNKIYFASDRTGTMNLFEFDIASKRVKQVTNSTEWDVRWPSKGDNGEIVYEFNGELMIYDTKAGGQPRKIRINVPDDGISSRSGTLNVGTQVAEMDLSPKGERALFVAHGDVFTAPIEKGSPRNLTRSSNAHDRLASWSPDGRKILFVSDTSGEEELYTVDQDGNGKPEQLTKGNKMRLYTPRWSPDGKRVVYSDRDGRIHVVKMEDKTEHIVAQEKRGVVTDYRWSPDSQWLAFSLADKNGVNVIYIWGASDGKLHRVTDGLFNCTSPAWDPEGNYLYFLSNRDYQPLISQAEFNFATTRTTGIFLFALRKDAKDPFAPESDEVSVVDEGKKDDAKKDDSKKDEVKKDDAKKPEPPKDAPKGTAAPVKIDFDGLAQRVKRVPIIADNFGSLQATKGYLIFVRQPSPYYGRSPETQPAIVLFGLKDRKETVLVENAGAYVLSQDGNKLMFAQTGQFNLVEANPAGKNSKKTVSTAALTVERVPSQEYAQIFNEVWRRFRDFFYVKNMHGYDWEALRRQYAPQLEYVAHRSDLNYVINEMIAELNVGHAYIDGGQWNQPPRPRVALPGARFELDSQAARYKIAKIFKGENEEATYRSPLTEVGLDVKEGDYILAIDGVDLPASTNPYQLLRGKANAAVTLTVNSRPDTNGARHVTFQPLTSETDLIYREMVEHNRAYVDKLSGGKVGYIHIPNMGAEGIREFIKWYYPQLTKEGLVIDDRWNGGGNVSRMIIERLRRELLSVQFLRGVDEPNLYPDGTFVGYMVCLLNENSASDGDIFPAMFRESKLGPLIGKRSWGGVVGITNHGNLVDGGVVNVPEFGLASPDGKWIIEGHGVDPDIVVENDPKSEIDGRDPQLERGVQEVMKRIQAKPKAWPNRPADPVKTK